MDDSTSNQVSVAWYVVVKGRPYRGTLEKNLSKEGVNCYIPVITIGKFVNDRMIAKVKPALSNLVFIQTDSPIAQIIERVDGLRYPYYDHVKGTPAIVPDEDLQRFRKVLELKSADAILLDDPYSKFVNHQKVRVVAGMFEGMEGVVVRVQRDRKLVVSLGEMAVAVSGIHPSLLKPII